MTKLLLTAALCGLMLPAFAHTEKGGKMCKTDAKTGKTCCPLNGAKTTALKSSKPVAGTRTAVYSVSKMECEGCSSALQAGLSKEKGVAEAKVDFKAKRATLRFDAKQTNPKKLEAAFKAKGFPAKLLKS